MQKNVIRPETLDFVLKYSLLTRENIEFIYQEMKSQARVDCLDVKTKPSKVLEMLDFVLKYWHY